MQLERRLDDVDFTTRASIKARQGVAMTMTEEATVLDPETKQPVPCDGETIGEIAPRSNTIMKGYLKNLDATAESFAGGYFSSGDLAVMHPNGYIEVKDRLKDIIISGGENISSVEVENALHRHPKSPSPRLSPSLTKNGAKCHVPLSS